MIELYIFNSDIELLGVVENYSSLRWLTEYNGLGEFQLVLRETKENIELLKIGNILWKNDSTNSMIIDFIRIEDNKIEVRGKSSNKLLSERIVLKQLNITNVEKGIKKAILDNALNEGRAIKCLELGEEKGITDVINKQFTYKPISELLKEIKVIGYSLDLDITRKKHIFNLYKGKDLTKDIVFSEDFDNVIFNNIEYDELEFRNYAIIGGRGEGSSRRIVYVDFTNGEERKELWVDGDDIEEKEFLDDGTEVLFTTEKINSLLKDRGIEKLRETNKVKKFDVTIIANGNFEYKKDYNVGDLVTCKSSKYNLQVEVRIASIQEIYEDSGYKILANLEYEGSLLNE